MKKRLHYLIFTAIVLCLSAVSFTSCSNDDDSLLAQLVGKKWLYLDTSSTNVAMVVSFGPDGKLMLESGYFYSHKGIGWNTFTFSYVETEENLLDIAGIDTDMAGFKGRLQIKSVGNGTAEIEVKGIYDEAGEEAFEEGVLTLTEVTEDSSKMQGVWAGYENGSTEPLFYYRFKPQNLYDFYEKGESGNWILDTDSKFYVYGNFTAFAWTERVGDSLYDEFEGYLVTKQDKDTYLYQYYEYGRLAISFVLKRAKESDWPDVH